MFTHKVIDDFVPEFYQRAISNYMQNAMNWKHLSNISSVPFTSTLPGGLHTAKFQNGFYGVVLSDSGDRDLESIALLAPMIERIREEIPQMKSIIRIRAGLFTQSSSGGIHNPHVDYYYPHRTLLYYVNDSDGDTILFDQKVSIEEGDSNPKVPEEFTILDKVSPKKGRALIFNGLNYHSSSLPKDHENRIALNINIEV